MFRRRRPRWLVRQVREHANSLRQMTLDLTPAEAAGMAPTPERPDVWAGHFEVGRPGGHWVMLAVIGNGLVSTYSSSEHGTLGLGERDGVRPAGPRWLAALQDGLALLPLSGPPQLPGPGRVVIRAMTYGGSRAVEAAEEDLAEGRHPAEALYRGAQDVVAQISLFEDRR